MPNDKEPRYVPDDEAANDGFFPDQPGSDLPETNGIFTEVYLGKFFEAKSGEITVQGVTLELPKQVRRTAIKIDVGLDGELHARPATPNERGGG